MYYVPGTPDPIPNSEAKTSCADGTVALAMGEQVNAKNLTQAPLLSESSKRAFFVQNINENIDLTSNKKPFLTIVNRYKCRNIAFLTVYIKIEENVKLT